MSATLPVSWYARQVHLIMLFFQGFGPRGIPASDFVDVQTLYFSVLSEAFFLLYFIVQLFHLLRLPFKRPEFCCCSLF